MNNKNQTRKKIKRLPKILKKKRRKKKWKRSKKKKKKRRTDPKNYPKRENRNKLREREERMLRK